MKKILSILFVFILISTIFTGCFEKDDVLINEDNNILENNSDNSTEIKGVDFSKTNSEMFTEQDYIKDYNQNDSVIINLNGTSSQASSDCVKINGSYITLTEQATYIISGTLTNGMLVVDADDNAELQIVLNGVNITNEQSAAIYVLKADKVFLTLSENTVNTLSNGGVFNAIDDNNIDAVIYSKQNLTINGTGSLVVNSPVGHGIVCKDDLVIVGGKYTVNSSSHGFDANDSVRIANATINIDAGKDAIHSENTEDTSSGFIYIENGNIVVEAEGDGIFAGHYIQIEDGTFDLFVGGGTANKNEASSKNYGGFMGSGMRPGQKEQSTTAAAEDTVSMKGLKANNSILINGGKFNINSADDSIHSNISVFINGGTFELASGDDAIHAEEELTVTSCDINISECYEGLEALNIIIKGGNINLIARDDGINAAGGNDSSGTQGGRDGMFGGGPGGMGAGMSSGNGSIVISGGNLNINASGDGIDANGSLEISGGYTVVVGPTSGDTSTLDYDKNAIITGGTFIGTGASGMAQSFSDSNQGVIALSVGNQSAKTEIIIKDSKSNTIITHTPELSYEVVIISSPDIKKGEIYSVFVGSQSGDIEAN